MGWGVGIGITLVVVSLEFKNYGGDLCYYFKKVECKRPLKRFKYTELLSHHMAFTYSPSVDNNLKIPTLYRLTTDFCRNVRIIIRPVMILMSVFGNV